MIGVGDRSGIPKYLIEGVLMGKQFSEVGWVRIGANIRPFVSFQELKRGRVIRVTFRGGDRVKVPRSDVRSWPAGVQVQATLFKEV